MQVDQRHDVAGLVIPSSSSSSESEVAIQISGGRGDEKCCGCTRQERDFLIRLGTLGVNAAMVGAAYFALGSTTTESLTVAEVITPGMLTGIAMADVGLAIANLCKDTPFPCGSDSLGNMIYGMAQCFTNDESAQKYGTYGGGAFRIVACAVEATVPAFEMMRQVGTTASKISAACAMVGAAVNGMATFASTAESKEAEEKSEALIKEQEATITEFSNQNTKLIGDKKDLRGKNKDLRDENKYLRKDIDNKNAKISAEVERNSKLGKENQEQESKIERQHQTISSQKEQIDKMSDEYKNLQEKLAETEAKLATLSKAGHDEAIGKGAPPP
ncbi:hypothetical protein EO087_10225 [Dyella sp. M7H15-1]|uniref:hypothetical protein n=1 Tax=Dyella sp. M7H15-1 TaxID=2501295 RepID=UPI001005131E|nr:hypothetical protein [Dyella sp. M7H15-1]QAU24318.1 hypothetical protein EO087_10225 [Dyella sp. M7H15-1]